MKGKEAGLGWESFRLCCRSDSLGQLNVDLWVKEYSSKVVGSLPSLQVNSKVFLERG